MKKVIELNRKLCFHKGELSDANAAEAFSTLKLGIGKERTWEEALQHRVVLLVGEANTGKTTELDLLCQRLRAAGKQAFNFRLRDLVGVGPAGLDELLPGPLQAELERWHEGDEEGVFLLDSVDEAELIDPQAFFRCLKRAVNLVRRANLRRARWVVSTRPSAWFSTSVIGNIRDELTPPLLRVSDDGRLAGKSAKSLSVVSEAPLDLVLCALSPLSTSQATRLLKEGFDTELDTNAKELVANLGLRFAMDSPGNLKWLARIMNAERGPTSRQQAYELAARQLATPRNSDMHGSLEELLTELKALSAAGILCESWLFAFREAESTTTAGSLPLSELLSHKDIRFEKLLRAVPLTGDAGLQVVKFIPAHIQIFLAAQWFCDRAVSPSDQHALAELFTRESLAGPLVPLHLMVCAGWMANKLPHFRARMLQVAPQVVLFLGDMAEIPPEEGKQALELTMKLLARGHPLFHNNLTLTGDDYWHIGRPELHQSLCDAFELYCENDMCMRHLLHVMSCRRVEGALPLLHRYLQSERPKRLHRLCLEALEVCGEVADLEKAADFLIAQGDVHSELARVLVCALVRQGASVTSVVKLSRRLRTDGLSVKHYVEVAAEESPVHMALTYANALLKSDEREGPSETLDDGLDDGEPLTAVVAVALAIVRGVLSRNHLDSSQLCEVVEVLERVRSLPSQDGGFGRFTDLSELTDKHQGFKERALDVLSTVLSVDQAYMLLHGERWSYLSLTVDDVDLVERAYSRATSSSQKELLASVRDQLAPRVTAASTPTAKWSTRPSSKEVPRKFVQYLNTQRHQLAGCENAELVTRALGIVSGYLAEPLAIENWEAATGQYGDGLLQSLKQGVKLLWRKHAPLFDKANPRSMYYQTMAGLQGLHLELELEGNWESITEAQAARAFDYALHSLNSIPQWVERLATKFPTTFARHCEQTVASWRNSPTERELATKLVDRLTRNVTLSQGTLSLLEDVWAMVKEGAWEANSPGRSRAVELLNQHALLLRGELGLFVALQVQDAWDAEQADAFGSWLSLWLRLTPDDAVGWLEKHPTFTESQLSMLFSLGRDLIRRDKGILLPTVLGGLEECTLLSRLYLLFVKIAPHEKDVDYDGVHSPSARDEAGRFRDSLVGRISSVGGCVGYEALYSLATREDVSEAEMRWLHSLALTVADVASKGAAWTVREFRQYADSTDLTNIPLRDGENFWKAVRLDVEEVVRNLSDGQFSPRNLLLQTDERGMQLWLARELQLLAQGRYRLHRESELADATTPDVIAQGPSAASVTLELKLGDKRTEKSLLSDLELQLHDDYLRDGDSLYGMFVVMWKAQADARVQFRLDKKIEKVRLSLERRAEALTLSSKGRKHLKVVCFQCPLPVSKRHQKRPKPEAASPRKGIKRKRG